MPELDKIAHSLPAFEKALVLSPHPDDETLGCGGVMALLSGTSMFTVVAISSGGAVNIEEENRAALRRGEFEKAMSIFGISRTLCLDFPDGGLSGKGAELRKELSGLVDRERPQIIFCPSPFDPHPDHRETAFACLDLLEKFPLVRLAFYDVYGFGRFNTLVDIGQVLETKKKALSGYHFSMLKKEDIFIQASLSNSRARSLFLLRDSFYEAFWVTEPAMGAPEILSLLTFGLTSPPPEEALLGALRMSEALIDRVRTSEDSMASRDRAVGELTAKLSETEAETEVLRARLETIESGFLWNWLSRYFRLRERLFPQGTGRRKGYNKVAGYLRRSSRK